MTIKKITAVFFIICALFALSSCKPEDAEADTTVAEVETEAPEVAKLILVEDGKTDFKVIRSENAVGYALDTASDVYRKLKNELSADFKLTEDWLNPLEPDPATAHEILLFSTARPESEAALADLNFEGYIIRVTDCKVVIVGSSPASCNEALYCFFDQIIPENTEGGVIALPVGLEVKAECKNEPIDLRAAIAEGKTLGANFKILFEYKGRDGFTTSLGAATDGKYAYVIMKKNESGVETDRVIKVDMETWSVVLESEEMPLDHANDMTYDPVKKQLVVVNMLDNLVSIIDPETLTLTEQKPLSYGTWGVGYIDGAEQYAFLAYGSPSGLVITDGAFNPIRSSALADTTGYVGQGMDADAEYAYVPLSPQSGTKDNIIQIFEIKTGKYIGKISVNTLMESESMFHVGDDFFLHFNNQGSKIATLEFYEKFE